MKTKYLKVTLLALIFVFVFQSVSFADTKYSNASALFNGQSPDYGYRNFLVYTTSKITYNVTTDSKIVIKQDLSQWCDMIYPYGNGETFGKSQVITGSTVKSTYYWDGFTRVSAVVSPSSYYYYYPCETRTGDTVSKTASNKIRVDYGFFHEEFIALGSWASVVDYSF